MHLSSRNAGGNGVLAFVIRGVIPPISPTKGERPRSARTVFPNTSVISVSLAGADYDRTERFSYSPATGGTVAIDDLPVGVPLDITVSALDGEEQALSSWSGTAILKEGSNQLTATLAPLLGTTGTATVTSNSSPVTLFSNVAIPSGKAVVYDITITVTDSYTQLLYDTGKAEWAWMGVYGSSWEELIPTASDKNQGWVVLKPPADGIVRIVLANCVSSPGYPARELTGKVQARRTYFTTPTGSGSGWAPDTPSALSLTITGSSTWLLSEGSYSPINTVSPLAGGDVRLYGGFKAGEWSVRNPDLYETRITNINATPSATLSWANPSTGAVDGMSLIGGVPTSSAATIGLSIATTAKFVVTNCLLSGNASVGSISSSGNISSYGVNVSGAAAPEIAGCTITGGTINANNNNSPTTAGLYISSTGGTYIHDCDINGGSATTISTGYNASSSGVLVWNANAFAVIARCRIWGGVATATAASTAAVTSSGAMQTNNAVGTVIVNSLVSGGYAAALGGGAATTLGISVNELDYVVSGCSIDTGNPASGATRDAEAVLVNANTATAGTIAANLLFSSAAVASSTRVGIYEQPAAYGPYQIRGTAALDCTPLYKNGIQADFSASAATYKTNNLVSARTPSQEFTGYSAPTTFAQFLAQDWRPASGATIAGADSATSPADCGIAAAHFTTYPALALDLEGRARSYSALWSRGAYE